ncbi:MAG: response regulator [Candidatus Thermoplasmatota archaeon]
MTRSKSRRRVILVVDDELDVLLPLADLLDKLMPNVKVYAAQSAEEALAFLAQNSVDLVITDLRMPGLDGEHLLGVLNALRTRPASILMTGFPEPGAMFRCLNENQVGAIVTKPFDAAVMADTANRLLESRQVPGGVAA